MLIIEYCLYLVSWLLVIPMRSIGWQSISQSYGRYFAEFLNEGSPVHLRLLAQFTCVGLRYGCYCHNFRSFSWHFAHLRSPDKMSGFQKHLGLMCSGFAYHTPSVPLPESNNRQRLLKCVTPSKTIAG